MASPNLAVRVYPESLRTLAAGSISGTYAGIGSAIENPARILYIVNNTDALLTFSFNGVDDHFVIYETGFLLLDVTSNKADAGGSFAIAQGTRIYVSGAPTTGNVYLSVFYGSGTI